MVQDNPTQRSFRVAGIHFWKLDSLFGARYGIDFHASESSIRPISLKLRSPSDASKRKAVPALGLKEDFTLDERTYALLVLLTVARKKALVFEDRFVPLPLIADLRLAPGEAPMPVWRAKNGQPLEEASVAKAIERAFEIETGFSPDEQPDESPRGARLLVTLAGTKFSGPYALCPRLPRDAFFCDSVEPRVETATCAAIEEQLRKREKASQAAELVAWMAPKPRSGASDTQGPARVRRDTDPLFLFDDWWYEHRQEDSLHYWTHGGIGFQLALSDVPVDAGCPFGRPA